MNWNAKAIEHLERCREDSRARRFLSARLENALRRAGVSSARVAKWTNAPEIHVEFWRRGITSPPPDALKRIAGSLSLDLHWLCTGQTEKVDGPSTLEEAGRQGYPQYGNVSCEGRRGPNLRGAVSTS
ncbi:hypothetical protein Bphy_5268 [Paraburkholderia phymatum STM815]|uniref:HTH cro/C1-type domain-containing protein n=1 Tax=Paraburkholderia phymatum (strain DSM 17167 / CIP 108236 / LMG 21445 / STM815) TaxID=391038 RepID=B2JMV5_PARP8|nr:hypothetical protein Bphy_5268 [Paraburkholderia phymatum STM815]